MRLMLVAFAFLLGVSTCSILAQLPASVKLSPQDDREFNQELERLRSLWSTANDRAVIELQIANTYAAGGQYSEAIRRLKQLFHADLGFDPSRDPDFASLRNTIEFQSIMKEVRRNTTPILNSGLIATIDRRDIFPENLAFDPKSKVFFLGSTARVAIFRCPLRRACVPLVAKRGGEQGYILGLKIDISSDAVWATSNTPTGASLRSYNVKTGNLEQVATLTGKHVFNDLALSSTGIVYVSDTQEGSIYQLNIQTNTLQRLAPGRTFTAANGIAISPDERRLYVSAWGDGIEMIDLVSGAVKPIPHPDRICLSFIDGLYATQRSLIAIQNGPMLPRIVQFSLDKNGSRILGMTTLERRNSSFDGIATGTLVDKLLVYVANPQVDKKNRGRVNPLQILAVRLKQ